MSHNYLELMETRLNNITSNETDFSLPFIYVALNISAGVLYLLLVIIPSAILDLFLIILHYYFKTKKTPLNLIVINYCIAALIRRSGMF